MPAFGVLAAGDEHADCGSPVDGEFVGQFQSCTWDPTIGALDDVEWELGEPELLPIVDQLIRLPRIEVEVHAGEAGESAPSICEAAAVKARKQGFDAIIYDTAGRLAIDDELMRELEEIRTRVAPSNTLLVCDSLMGRDAVNVAQAFSERLKLDGLILT